MLLELALERSEHPRARSKRFKCTRCRDFTPATSNPARHKQSPHSGDEFLIRPAWRAEPEGVGIGDGVIAVELVEVEPPGDPDGIFRGPLPDWPIIGQHRPPTPGR